MSSNLDPKVPIRLMKDRKHQKIPLDKIKVVISRDRNQRQFSDNVRSIKSVGLYKPILVNERNLEKTGMYELICGQGRMMAHTKLGEKEIRAEVINVPDVTSHLMTLGENIARNPPAAIEYAYIIKDMHEGGFSIKDLSRITGRSTSFLSNYIKLVENGEERLIRGIEDGVFPITFAISVAGSSSKEIQHVLMDAFDNNVIKSTNICRVRQIIEDRIEKGKSIKDKSKKEKIKYTVDSLKRDISKITKEKEAFVNETSQKEARIYRIVNALQMLANDTAFSKLLEKAGLATLPELKCEY